MPALFAKMARFAVFDLQSPCAGAAVFAYVLAAIDAVVSLIGALSDVAEAFAAVLAMIAVVVSALGADAAGLAKLVSGAKRTFVAFRAIELLVAFDTVFAAGRAVVVHAFTFIVNNVVAAVFTHFVCGIVGIFLNALFTVDTVGSIDKCDAVFASHAHYTVRYITVCRVYAAFHTLRTMEPEFVGAKHAGHTVFTNTSGRTAFTNKTVETYKDVFILRIKSIAPTAFKSIGVDAVFRSGDDRRERCNAEHQRCQQSE